MASVSAVAVAVRGPGSNSESSPNISPSPMTASSDSRPSLDGVAELDLALGDDVEPVAGVALGEQDVALEQPALVHRRLERRGGLDVECGEQRRAHEHVVHGGPPCSGAAIGTRRRSAEGQCVLSHARGRTEAPRAGAAVVGRRSDARRRSGHGGAGASGSPGRICSASSGCSR